MIHAIPLPTILSPHHHLISGYVSINLLYFNIGSMMLLILLRLSYIQCSTFSDYLFFIFYFLHKN